MEDAKISTCRVCLNSALSDSGKSLSLFEKLNDSLMISEKIIIITNVEIKQGDGLPDKICSACLLELETAYNFKKKCENSNVILHTTIKLQEQFVEVLIKKENLDDYEYDYLDEDVLSPQLLQNDIKLEGQDTQQTDSVVRPSRAIDLKLECHDCGGLYKSKCKLRVHWKKAHLTAQLICPSCKRKFKSYKAYHSHLKRKTQSCVSASKMRIEGEGKSRVFHCKDCDYRSLRIKDMMSHLVVHSGERPYVCDLCGKTFTQQSVMQAHKEGTHKSYVKDGVCQHCGKYIQGRNKLYRHMKSHKKLQIQCKFCPKVLSTKNSYKQHMRRHSGIKAFTCDMCAKTFYTSSDLGNHRNKFHFKKKSKMHTCNLCEYKSVHPSVMGRHTKRHTEHNISCELCGTFVDNAQQLELHKKRHFEKNYQCTHCDKKYFSRKNLSAHVRSKHKNNLSAAKSQNSNYINTAVISKSAATTTNNIFIPVSQLKQDIQMIYHPVSIELSKTAASDIKL